MTQLPIMPSNEDGGRSARAGIFAWFSAFARWSADAMGSASAFVIATAACVLWAISGPWFEYSDTWQLVINTATTVLTFLAVFLIQHTQNKDNQAIQLKLDELIHTSKGARNLLIDVEYCSDDELRAFQREFTRRRLEPDLSHAKTREAAE